MSLRFCYSSIQIRRNKTQGGVGPPPSSSRISDRRVRPNLASAIEWGFGALVGLFFFRTTGGSLFNGERDKQTQPVCECVCFGTKIGNSEHPAGREREAILRFDAFSSSVLSLEWANK